MRKRVLIVCLVAGVLAVAGYWFLVRPNPIVATVNGQQITRAQLNERVATALAQYEAYGLEITGEILAEARDGAVDELVVEALLSQGAEESGIVVETADIDEFYADWVSEYESEAVFLDMLRENDYTVERLRTDIARHLLISQYEEKYIAEHVDPASLVVTETEKRELYDSYADEIDDLPPYEEIAEDLEAELRDKKIYELGIIEDLVDELRTGAEIEITL